MATHLDTAIDELYRQPLSEFVSARAALARTLTGSDAATVKALKKPLIVPWAVNQVYWRARDVFERVRKAGAAVRREQVAALTKGRGQELKPLMAAHRAAVASAVDKAVGFARAVDAQPSVESLTQTFEALSLAEHTAEPFGRFTQPLRPGGFEMLSGVTPRALPDAAAPVKAIDKKREQKRKAEEKRRAAAIAEAERDLAKAAQREERARGELEAARAEVSRAKRALDELQSKD